MRDPEIVGFAALHPGACAGCGAHKGPMVDTMVEYDEGLRLYVCVDTCLDTWAKKAGYLSGAKVAALQEQLDEAVAKLAEAQTKYEARARDEMGLLEAVATRAVQKAFADPVEDVA